MGWGIIFYGFFFGLELEYKIIIFYSFIIRRVFVFFGWKEKYYIKFNRFFL